MPSTRCVQCSAHVPAAARFCPRCGHAAADVSTPVAVDRPGEDRRSAAVQRAPGALPSTSRMPLAGILFLAAAVLGPTLIAVGVSTGNPLPLVAGIGVAVILIALLLVGMVF